MLFFPDGKEYENIPPPLFFKCLNINTLLITPTNRNGSGFAILCTFFVKNILVRFKKINKCKHRFFKDRY